MNIYEKLLIIQTKLKAPKNQVNKFGGYNYRNCEDILEALKPILEQVKATLTITDEIVMIGTRYYIKSTATLIDIENDNQTISNVAYAREEESKKGMDASQLTGACSSYARKYALNGLFAIDDTKDIDTLNNNENTYSKQNKTINTTKTNNAETKKLITDNIINLFNTWIAKNNIDKSIIDSVLNKYGFKAINEVDTETYKKIVNELNNILKKEENL